MLRVEKHRCHFRGKQVDVEVIQPFLPFVVFCSKICKRYGEILLEVETDGRPVRIVFSQLTDFCDPFLPDSRFFVMLFFPQCELKKNMIFLSSRLDGWIMNMTDYGAIKK